MEKIDTKIKIYYLKDPESLKIRYVGMTSKSLEYRLKKHIENAKYTKHNKHLCNWINKLLKNNLKPIIELIEEVNFDIWQQKEIYYISIYPNLLNFTKGGEGTFGYKHTEETKEVMRALKIGIKPSKETLEKRSKALKGRIVTEEHREKIRISNLGKIHTKYKIIVKDLLNNSETICVSVAEVHRLFNVGDITVRRNLNNNKIVKNQFIFMKV